MIISSCPARRRDVASQKHLWRRFAQALDRFVASRTKGAVPQTSLRRSKADFNRCRRLILNRQAEPAKGYGR